MQIAYVEVTRAWDGAGFQFAVLEDESRVDLEFL